MSKDILKTPFPWFGGKSHAADLIWSRLGTDCGNYIEPFFGSGAILLNRPDEYSGWLTVNDLDGHIANVWRSIKLSPEQTAEYSCNPVNECDLHARHCWLNNNVDKLTKRLMADPEYHDPRAAGYWIWGTCSWIGSGWCSGKGPWQAVPGEDGILEFTKNGGNGNGVWKQKPCLNDGGQGVNRKIPHLGDGGKGVNRKIPHLGDGGKGERLEWIMEWFLELQDKLADARVCCGDWTRIMTVSSMTRNGLCAVVLDPPYSQTDAVYANDSSTISHDVRSWCVDNGANPKLRIALCGHDGEHNELESMGWSVETWSKHGGYQGKDDRERIWFSPACVKNEYKVPRVETLF